MLLLKMLTECNVRLSNLLISSCVYILLHKNPLEGLFVDWCNNMVTGNNFVWVQLLLMDTVSESLSSHTGETTSTTPYRSIETSRTLMPGGTLVTTTTTTTDRLKDVHTRPRYNGEITSLCHVGQTSNQNASAVTSSLVSSADACSQWSLQ